MSVKNNYNHTILASYIGSASQAIEVNFAPLLFLTFQSTFNIPIEKITLLITMNFAIQLLTDLIAAKFVDKIGYRIPVVAAHVLVASGLAGLAIFPSVFPTAYSGLMAATFLYAVGGGLEEVLISPIVEACPTENKSAAMSLLHSFYCWGSVLVIALSTLFFKVFGIENWRILALLWAIVPAFDVFYFSVVPINTLNEHGRSMSFSELAKSKLFWVLILLMVCSGAAEQSMSQWASSFAESALGVSKATGDLLGPCFFAVMMGVSRVSYAKFSEKINLTKFMVISALMCICSYLLASLFPVPLISLIGCGLCGLSVGIMWPGTFSTAAIGCPKGGTAMFALLALAGDLGCTSGPTLVGFVSGYFNGNLKSGLLAAIVFPIVMIFGIALYVKIIRKEKSAEI